MDSTVYGSALSTMLPPEAPQLTKKAPARRHTPQEWATQKELIVELYPQKGMTLRKISGLLAEKGFHAT